MTENEQRIEVLSGRLLECIEQRINEPGGIELKDYKAVTGALKELKELSRGGVESDEKRGSGFEVRFVGDAEEMSG